MKNWSTRFFAIMPNGNVQYFKQFEVKEVSRRTECHRDARLAGRTGSDRTAQRHRSIWDGHAASLRYALRRLAPMPSRRSNSGNAARS